MHSPHLRHSSNPSPSKQVNVEGSKSVAVPFEQWPIWCKGLSLLKTDADRGIGDVIERIIGPVNSAKFKEWYKITFGKSCGCTVRQKRFNEEFPFTL